MAFADLKGKFSSMSLPHWRGLGSVPVSCDDRLGHGIGTSTGNRYIELGGSPGKSPGLNYNIDPLVILAS